MATFDCLGWVFTVLDLVQSIQYHTVHVYHTVPYNTILGGVFCKIKTLRGLFAMFRSQSDSKIQIFKKKSMHGAAAAANRILRGW